MPADKAKRLDIWAEVVIAITAVLFITALFIKGLKHDVLLESAVFLVSAKLVIMASRSRILAERLEQRLDQMQDTLCRCEDELRRK